MPSRDINDIKIPNHTKYIIVFDKLESEVEYDGNKYTLPSTTPINETYYCFGRFLTSKDVAKEFGENPKYLGMIEYYNFCGLVIAKDDNTILGIPKDRKFCVIDSGALAEDGVESQ